MNYLAMIFDNVANGRRTKYWMSVLRGLKGLQVRPGISGDEALGYRVGQRLAGLGIGE